MRRQVTELGSERAIAWAQTGEGRDVLAIHGALVTLEDMWLGAAPALAERFRVTAIDRPGHGLSRRPRSSDASPWRQAALIHEFVQQAGLDRPILVGHSFGGTVALVYAALFPEATSGVVALAPMCLPELRPELLIFGPRAVPVVGDALARTLSATNDHIMMPLLWRAMYLPQAMPSRVARDFPFSLAGTAAQTIVEGEDAAALPAAVARLAGAFPFCEVPTRFLAGSADMVVVNGRQGRVAAGLMPNATYKILPGVGHMLHHFAPGEVLAAALDLADAA